ncbi:MAG: 4Fe-4S binding protein [Treponema sp.]|nr:4Fe-4S binding protein [Treponema sp.]
MGKSAVFRRPAVRRLLQFLSALIYNADVRNFAAGTVSSSPLKRACVPGLNCYSCPGALSSCPLGALQNSLAQGRFPFYVTGLLLLFGLVFGRAICGFLCPFGLIQELIYRIPGPKLGKNALTRRLSLLKYAFLALPVLALPLGALLIQGYGVPFFCEFLCPAGTLEAALPLILVNPSIRELAGGLFLWKLGALAALVLASLFLFRFFCRFICPLGALYGLFNRFALLGMQKNRKRCTNCGECAANCKMDTRQALDRECIRCGECIGRCPSQALWIGKRGPDYAPEAPFLPKLQLQPGENP